MYITSKQYGTHKLKDFQQKRDRQGKFTKKRISIKPFLFFIGIAIVIVFGNYSIKRNQINPIAYAEQQEMTQADILNKYETLLKEQQDQINTLIESIHEDKLSF